MFALGFLKTFDGYFYTGDILGRPGNSAVCQTRICGNYGAGIRRKADCTGRSKAGARIACAADYSYGNKERFRKFKTRLLVANKMRELARNQFQMRSIRSVNRYSAVLFSRVARSELGGNIMLRSRVGI